MAAAILASRTLLQNNAATVTPIEDVDADSMPSSPNGKNANERSPIAAWSVQRVSAWLQQQGFQKLSESSLASTVDGSCLLELNTAAWAELGCTSAVQCCKLVALVKKEAASVAADSHPVSAPAPPAAAQQYYDEGRNHEEKVAKHFTAGMSPRSPDGGAEHNISWVLAVANANANPAEVKQHCLRFLGMYNVIDLLVLTIDVTYLMTAELTGIGPTSWAGYHLVGVERMIPALPHLLMPRVRLGPPLVYHLSCAPPLVCRLRRLLPLRPRRVALGYGDGLLDHHVQHGQRGQRHQLYRVREAAVHPSPV